ncbi:hypothetical protein [Chlorobium limicola]
MAIEKAKQFVETIKQNDELARMFHNFTIEELVSALQEQKDLDDLADVAGGTELCIGGKYC